jgi:O-antigen/teichoic acid export membrane protein
MPNPEVTGAEMLPARRLKEEAESLGGQARMRSFRQPAEDLTWVIAGKLVMMGANAVLMLLLAKVLELKLFGLLVTSISGQLLLSRVLLLGVETGVVRLHTLPELRHQDRELFNAGWFVIWQMSALSILVALAAMWARDVSAEPRWPDLVIASVVAGAIGTALVDYSYSFHLSHVRYRRAALSQSLTAVGRLAITLLTVLVWPQHTQLAFLAYVCASLASGLAQAALIRSAQSGGESRPVRSLMRRLLRFSVWQGGANFVALLNLYQGTFILTWSGQEAAAGIFGLALTLSMGFYAIYNAYGEYLLSRIARVKRLSELPSFLLGAFGGALMLALCCVPVAITIEVIVTRILDLELGDFVPVFYCLSASILLLVCQCPLEATCKYLLRPQLLTFERILRVICVGGLALMLARRWGAWGAAVAQLGGTAMVLVAFATCVIVALRAARKAETASHPSSSSGNL